jgi:hypothetical protein
MSVSVPLSSKLHEYNELLPECERSHILEEDEVELKKLLACLDDLQSDTCETINAIKFGRCLRFLKTRQNLKYQFAPELCDQILNVFYLLVTAKRTSVVQRKTIMTVMSEICKKKGMAKKLSFTFDWRPFWDEILEIALRWRRPECVSNADACVELLDALAEFLHCGRNLLNDDVAQRIARESLEFLDDLRNPSCYEGLLMLVLCLPTKFSQYDEYLPRWIKIWSNISHNPTWDYCWLSIFARARKHTKSFDWTSLSPLLFSKGNELIVPLDESVPKGSSHMLHIPHYYRRLALLDADPDIMALSKLAKLMYFMTLLEPGSDSMLIEGPRISITPTTASTVLKDNSVEFTYSGFTKVDMVHKGAVDISMFFQSIRCFLHPTTEGIWTRSVGAFVTTFVGELSRHFGRNYAHNLVQQQAGGGTSAEAFSDDHSKFKAPIHMPTVRYMLGFFTVIVMETLYVKDCTTFHFYASCLKNLVTLDPTLSSIIVPYLLAALDARIVSQSHQAPLALQAFWVLIKPLLFPNPLIIRYVPHLLKALLPAIDPNDQKKTIAALSVLITLFAHIPIRTDYSGYTNTSAYLDTKPYICGLTVTDDAATNDYCEWMRSQLEDDLSTYEPLGNLWTEWLPAFWSRIFQLLEAEDEPQNGFESELGDIITECISVMLYACESDDLVEESASIISWYFLSSQPTKSVKTSSKIVGALIARKPSALSETLSQLLESRSESGGIFDASTGS